MLYSLKNNYVYCQNLLDLKKKNFNMMFHNRSIPYKLPIFTQDVVAIGPAVKVPVPALV